jgi:cysteine desulfurase
MTITAHKLHGPVGIGALLLRHGIAIAPQLFGGFQQLGLRPGTEMPVLAAGFALAVRIANQNLQERHDRMQSLRDSLESQIHATLPEAVIIGQGAPRLPNTSSIAFPDLDRQALQLALDLAEVACSTGSACASGSSQPSHVLAAMGLSPSWTRGAVRFSLSYETTQAEIDAAADKITESVRRLSKHRP